MYIGCIIHCKPYHYQRSASWPANLYGTAVITRILPTTGKSRAEYQTTQPLDFYIQNVVSYLCAFELGVYRFQHFFELPYFIIFLLESSVCIFSKLLYFLIFLSESSIRAFFQFYYFFISLFCRFHQLFYFSIFLHKLVLVIPRNLP